MINENLSSFYSRSKHSPPIVISRSSAEEPSPDVGGIPREEMEPPKETSKDLPQEPELMEVDQSYVDIDADLAL